MGIGSMHPGFVSMVLPHCRTCQPSNVCRYFKRMDRTSIIEVAEKVGVNAHADQLVGPTAGSELPPASGGGPGVAAGSYGAPNAPPNTGEPLVHAVSSFSWSLVFQKVSSPGFRVCIPELRV